ncbi:sulfatase family protein [Marinoscillum furvescens]|uniref:Putative sulfatase n=1 Tax=Marinoscillum furvescens DSM 4134 TaxID=1122208 RepID=A0A3D9L0J1_MARFU|nr:sulfatase [Marinoscillum furvescens]RED95959.1 putative sulfatase [Marinoscillum furvescens DSM 4134]
MRVSLIFFLLAAWFAFSCAQQEKSKPNILWIVSDDLSPDLGCYGNSDVQTPNLDALAHQGVKFTKAYANTPICSPSRSSFITGMYPSTINALQHRTMTMQPLPDHVSTIVSLMQKAGYFCTNASGKGFDKNGKRDYNFSTDIKYDGTDWRDADGQPFFAQVQFKYPHRPFEMDEGHLIHPEQIGELPCYPDHPLLKADWAAYLSDIQLLDTEVGKVLKRLEEDGLAENTVVMFFGDHGRPHLRDKQFLYEGGLKVPLIVRWPQGLQPAVDDQLVSLVDVAATTLELAGLDIPDYMHGQSFLDETEREFVFGFRGRAGDAVDDIRSITDGEYKLIWNRLPQQPYMQLSSYKKAMYPAFTLYHYLDSLGQLSEPYNQFMADSRPEFELYHLDSDPCEYQNLSGQKTYAGIEEKLKHQLQESLLEFEQNAVGETLADLKKAKQGSYNYSKKVMERDGFDVDAPLSAWVNYWYTYYGLKDG